MRDAVSEWQALSALYEQAETLTAPELDVWLARLRREDHPLVEPLQQMLGARAQVQGNGFLSALPQLTAMAAALSDDRAGERVGPYRLLAPIGSGGMAEVWRAERDDGAFRRTVAIKLLFRHMGGARGESFAQRFSRERDILASLDHPNIAGLHDAGVTPAGQPWLALEYVEGEPLIAWCDRARLGVRGRVEVFRQVLLAVEHAHANLVIHRDLKPANILVSGSGDVHLLDFGIAKLMEAEGGVLDDTELTRHAGRLMTVAYASPEQLTGRPLTTATDVYSLGVVLYELLCGERPYEVRTDVPARLEQAILEVDPRPPSRRALSDSAAAARNSTEGALRKALAHDLDAIVLRALAKQPVRRYGSCEALRVELDRWLAGEPVDARTPSRVERLQKFVLRHPVGSSLGAAATLALLTVAGAAVALGLQAREESARATAARDFMMGMFKQADADKSHGADMTARELLDRGRDDVLKRLKDQPALQADLLRGIAGIQSSMGEVTKADLTFEALAKLRLGMGDTLATAGVLAARAENALLLGRVDLAEALVGDVERMPPSVKGDVRIASSVGSTRGWLALWGGDAGRAKALFLKSLALAEATYGLNSSQAQSALVGVVQSNAALRDFEAALAAQSDLASREKQFSGRTLRDDIGLDQGRAELLFLAGNYREAAALKEASGAECVRALGAADVTCRRLTLVGAQANLLVGSASSAIGDLPALQAVAEDASSPDFQATAAATVLRLLSRTASPGERTDLARRMRLLIDGSIATATDGMQQLNLVQALFEDDIRSGRIAEAHRLIEEISSSKLRYTNKKVEYASVGAESYLQSVLWLLQGNPANALPLVKRGRTMDVAVYGATHPLVSMRSVREALVLALLGRFDEALDILDKSEPTLRKVLGQDSPSFSRLTHLRQVVLDCQKSDSAMKAGCIAALATLRPVQFKEFFF